MSSNSAEKLCLQDEFALLVLLTSLICLIIFPTHSLFALSTVDVAYYVAPSGHVTLVGLRLGNVDNAIEQIRFAMLATEVLQNISIFIRAFGQSPGELTLLRMSSWLERCVLQFLQP